jgi:hypothetical protein
MKENNVPSSSNESKSVASHSCTDGNSIEQENLYFPNATVENRLIAEFMGKTYHPKLERLNLINELNYHSSWDWLMPVLEKISRTVIEWENSDDRTDTYFPRTFGMLNAETGRPMVRINGNTLHEADTLMEATYLAIVDFLMWRKLKP